MTSLLDRLDNGSGSGDRMPRAARLAARAGRALLLRRLAGIVDGRLTIIDGGTTVRLGTPDTRCPLAATIQVHDPRFWSDAAFGGSVGAGESYVRGDWSVDDLTALVRILLVNRAVIDGIDSGPGRFAEPLRRLAHWASRNTRAGSRRNIHAHYDLGNDFFRLFLDPTLMYSAAWFDRADSTLQEASVAKLERICRRLALGPGDHVLEIGTGWGGFALHAARHHGCRVTTTTISREQHALARERIDAAGLADRITLLDRDYRDLDGRYDKLVSIEMIEAVGHRYYDGFFRQCARLLKPDGLMLLQAITIDDRRYAAARDSVDFIQRYVFPGGCLPSVTALAASATRASDLRIVHLDDIGLHYARTLAAWRANLHGQLDQVRALGLPDSFVRLWEFYLCYCEGGFAERALGTAQIVMARPQARWNEPPRAIAPHRGRA